MTTEREKFLAGMDKTVPWTRLRALIGPRYSNACNGWPPPPLLRIHRLKQWYGLSGQGMEEAFYDMESMRRFAGIELNDDAAPDETSILNLDHHRPSTGGDGLGTGVIGTPVIISVYTPHVQ